MHAGIHYYAVAQRQAELSERSRRNLHPVKAEEPRSRKPSGGLLALLRLRRPAAGLEPAASSRAV
jgi:hypothetical protein